MAQTSWPFENIDTTETEFSQWARNIGEGVVTDRQNELEPTADGSGMTVFVDTGEALVRGHYYKNTASETVTIGTANPTNPRIDSVVLRLDPTANSITLAVLAGTAAVSPSAPTLTQTDTGIYEQLIANVTVPAGAVVIQLANVSDQRTLLLPNADLVALLGAKQNTITGGASTITSTNLTANRALISDGSGKVAVSPVTNTELAVLDGITATVTELNYTDGVTSNIQTQLDGKVDEVNGAVTTAATGSTVVRNITLSTSDPSGGADGDVWLKYEA